MPLVLEVFEERPGYLGRVQGEPEYLGRVQKGVSFLGMRGEGERRVTGRRVLFALFIRPTSIALFIIGRARSRQP